jgi:hypothetical protein
VIARRPAQEGTSLIPEHTKVTIELSNRRRLLPCRQFGTGIFVWPAAVTTDRLNFAQGGIRKADRGLLASLSSYNHKQMRRRLDILTGSITSRR